MAQDTRKAVLGWAQAKGYEKALGCLTGAGVSPRAAEELCKGTYKHEPKSLLTVLSIVLGRDGISLAGEKAS